MSIGSACVANAVSDTLWLSAGISCCVVLTALQQQHQQPSLEQTNAAALAYNKLTPQQALQIHQVATTTTSQIKQFKERCRNGRCIENAHTVFFCPTGFAAEFSAAS